MFEIREENTGEKTILKIGDIIAYNEVAQSIVLWRPQPRFPVNLPTINLTFNGKKEFYFPLSQPNDIIAIVKFISAGLSYTYNRIYDHPVHKYVFILKEIFKSDLSQR